MQQRVLSRTCQSCRTARSAVSMVTAAQMTVTRTFVQGAPPVPKKDIDKGRKQYLTSSHADEMETNYQRRQREIHEHFAKYEPNCPQPLEENAFVKGKFGMRRRYFVDHRDKINVHSLNEALAESTNAMRK